MSREKTWSEHASDWIEWNGGECPVDRATVVNVRLRCGLEDPDFPAATYRWAHVTAGDDIVAYRVADTSRASALTRQPGGTHYRDATIQPVQFIEANGLQFLEGCIVKRAARHDKPTGKGREDIEKIIHEAQLLLELRYGVA